MNWQTTISINIPTQVTFGWGTRNKFGEILAGLNQSRVLIVASDRMLQRPLIVEMIDDLSGRGIALEFFTNVQPNPRTQAIDDCVAEFSDMKIDHVLGIGGGSALDQAKATAMALHMARKMSVLLASKDELPKRKISLSLMPTTSGTGAEVSFGAIVTDAQTNVKTGLRGRNLAADYAIVDPELTLSVPREMTMVTGFDVLTHALETFLSRKATAYTTAFSEQAIKNVYEYLPILYQDPLNIEARSSMAYASMICGLNLALSTTCLPHRLQYPIGAATDTSHAEGLAALYPAWLEAVLPFSEDKLARCAQWIGVDQGSTDKEKAEDFVAALRALMAQIKMQRTLADLGVDQSMAMDFVEQVTGNLSTDPGPTTVDDIRQIYIKSL